MRTTKINDELMNMVINLLKNVNGLTIENEILNNCHILLNDKEDIEGTISYEKYDKIAIIRYFVFKRNVSFDDLLLLYQSLGNELIDINIDNSLAIINSNEVKEVFEYLGFKKIDKNKVFFDETQFIKTNYKDNDVYLKKLS